MWWKYRNLHLFSNKLFLEESTKFPDKFINKFYNLSIVFVRVWTVKPEVGVLLYVILLGEEGARITSWL